MSVYALIIGYTRKGEMIEKPKRLNVPAHKQCVQMKVALVGDQYAGKSWFLSRYLSNEVPGYYEATLGVDTASKYIPLKNTLIHLTLWDFSGKEDFFELRNEFYKEAHAVIIFVDLSSKEGSESVEKWLKEIKDGEGGGNYWVVGTKADNKKYDGSKAAKDKNCAYFQTSAKSGEGVETVMEKVIGSIK